MKILLRELADAYEGLNKILGIDQDIKLAYRIRKIASKIISEMKHIEDTRQSLIVKYGEKQPDGSYRIAKLSEEFKKEMEDLLNIEIDFEFQLIPFECFEKVKLSAYDIARLEKFIEEPTAEQLKTQATPVPAKG